MTLQEVKKEYPDFFSDENESFFGTEGYKIIKDFLVCHNSVILNGEGGAPHKNERWVVYDIDNGMSFCGTFSTPNEAQQAVKVETEQVKV